MTIRPLVVILAGCCAFAGSRTAVAQLAPDRVAAPAADRVGAPAATQPATSPATLPADASTPKGALRQLFLATDAGDQARIRSLLHATTPQEEKTAELTAQMSAALVQFQKSLADTFGADQASALLNDPAGAARRRDELMPQVTETITGDSAFVRLDTLGAFQPMEFKKVDQAWKARVRPMSDDQLAGIGIQVKVLNDVATEIAAGKHKSLPEVKQALEAKVRQGVTQYAESQRRATTAPTTTPTPAPKQD